MGMNYIDAEMLKKAFLAGAKGLEANKEWINELNAFPVPDGDTGTNMTMTILSAAREVAAIEKPTMESLAKAISSGSLVWIVRKSDEGAEVLLQKRAMNKDSFPGRYDTSSAGHIQAGDEPEESAIRELHEELGIKASVDDLQFVDTFIIQYEKEFYGKVFKGSEIAFVYVYTKPVNIDELTLQKEELDGVEWFNLEYVYEECRKHNQKFCAPVGGLEIVRRFVRGTGL